MAAVAAAASSSSAAAGAEKTAAAGAAAAFTPNDFVHQIVGRPVVVKLNSGVDYRGAQHPFASGLSPPLALSQRV